MKSLMLKFAMFFALTLLVGVGLVPAQKIDSTERARLASMLSGLKGAIKDDYYDPEYHGIDLDERFQKASDKLKQVQTTGQGFGVIAQVLLDFNDSHLFFFPPLTNIDVDYGYRDEMIGDKCYIWTVNPASSAASKGLKAGDEIVAIEGYPPSRADLWKMNYFYNVLNKKSALTLQVQSPGEESPRLVQFDSKIFKNRGALTGFFLSKMYRDASTSVVNYFAQVGNITVWKFPSFSIDPASVDGLMDRVRTPNLIIDLRGNGGGYVATLERLSGFLYDKEFTIAELKGRKKMDPMKNKPQKDRYTGNIIVLVDSRSASASEIFARLLQLQQRGKVVGDVSAGAVMQAREFTGSTANDTVIYGASITNADVIMSDGKSIEHVGVTPDVLVLPTGADLAAGSDPVLSKAVEMLGGSLSPAAAGALYSWVWKDDLLELRHK